MLFNSIDFAIFLPVVFMLYWSINGKYIHGRNLLIVLASYVFYGWWDWRFLSLILFSTIIDYSVGLGLKKEQNPGKRKQLLLLSIFCNLGMLLFFKYYNFFLQNFIEAFTYFGITLKAGSLKIILPIGISFYTFQTLSYTIDVYKRKLEPTTDFVAFAAFVSFFPQLVAGPIERATRLLPQFSKSHTFDRIKAVDGLRQILWGLFKKMVIADNCAVFADAIFSDAGQLSGSTLALGAIFFSFQIYGDFSGYSDIAIGTARLFGFNLSRNFAYPYFSRDIAEYWRRWHISLSTWFRDYVYIPLGGSRGSRWNQIRNVFIIFIVSGFWHGANWTFVIWGFLNALYFIPLLLRKKNRKYLDIVAKGKLLPSLKESTQILFTFLLTAFTWIFFRAESLSEALIYSGNLFSNSFFSMPFYRGIDDSASTVCLIILFVIMEWLGRDAAYAIEKIGRNRNRFWRWSFYAFLVFTLFLFMPSIESPFIYFQF